MTLEELLQESIELEKKKKELAAKTVEINNAIAAEKKRMELDKEQLITIEKVANGLITLNTHGTPRQDVLELLRATPSRNYDHIYQQNYIHITYWEQFKTNFEKLEKVKLVYKDELKEKLEQYFTEPLWHVKMTDKFIVIKNAERNTQMYILDKIPSKMYNTMVKAVVVPFSEGWRVIQVLGPPSQDVIYEADVMELIEKQIEQRKKMDEVALAMDADLPNPFVGINPESGKVYELKPFQRAGVFFMMNALGLDIPKPKPKW